MKPLRLEIDGKPVEAICLKVGNTLWAHINGRTVVFESEKTRSGKKQQQIDDPTKIKAPMPGKIIKVPCAEGDMVEKDHTLVVMEAMKMEYSLKSFVKARVKKLKVSEAQQVTLGQILVELEEVTDV